MRQPSCRSSANSLLVIVAIAAAVLAFWFFTPSLIHWYHPDFNIAEQGQFGDTFGVLNALFSGLAFVGVAAAVWFQMKELSEVQTQAIQQSFESKFFGMLELHHEIVSQMTYNEGRVDAATGRRVFSGMYAAYAASRMGLHGTNDISKQEAKLVYENFYNSNSAYLGHYFRNLYRIVKLIDDSKVDDKKTYSGIVRAQLSRDELRLLFYNGFSFRGDKFERLIEKYALMEHLPVADLYRQTDFAFYRREAFSDQQIL